MYYGQLGLGRTWAEFCQQYPFLCWVPGGESEQEKKVAALAVLTPADHCSACSRDPELSAELCRDQGYTAAGNLALITILALLSGYLIGSSLEQRKLST